MAGPPLGGGRSFLQHTHPHLLSSFVGWAAEGLLWSLIQLLLGLSGGKQWGAAADRDGDDGWDGDMDGAAHAALAGDEQA